MFLGVAEYFEIWNDHKRGTKYVLFRPGSPLIWPLINNNLMKSVCLMKVSTWVVFSLQARWRLCPNHISQSNYIFTILALISNKRIDSFLSSKQKCFWWKLQAKNERNLFVTWATKNKILYLLDREKKKKKKKKNPQGTKVLWSYCCNYFNVIKHNSFTCAFSFFVRDLEESCIRVKIVWKASDCPMAS